MGNSILCCHPQLLISEDFAEDVDVAANQEPKNPMDREWKGNIKIWWKIVF